MPPALTNDQLEGARFLAARRCAYLADVPGLGKTAQYIRALDYVAARSAIIVCPPVLRSKLQDEFNLWSLWGHRVHVIETGTDAVPPDGIVAISYALLLNPSIMRQLVARQRGPLILDEAHATKEPESKRTFAALGQLAPAMGTCWFVSGTPAPNHAGELYPFARLSGVWRESYDAYVARFCKTRPDKFAASGRKVVGTSDPEALRRLLWPVLLRRTEVTGRPALSVDTMPVECTDAYADMAAEYVDDLRAAVAADDMSLADIEHMSTVRRLTGLAKIDSTIAIARDAIASGHTRLLVFGTHIDVLRAITNGLVDLGAELINGQTSAAEMERITRQFQTDDSATRIIVGNMQTLGEAVTLTAANRVLIAEPSWTPKDNTQVIARAWRRGQKKPVHVSFLSVAGSIDDAITRTVMRKAADTTQILD